MQRPLTRQERTRRRVYIAFALVMCGAFASFLSAVLLSSAYPPPQVPYGEKDPAAHALRPSAPAR